MILNKTDLEYIKSLIPDRKPDWKKVWEEGLEIGKSIKIEETPFSQKYGMRDVEYRLKQAEQGKISWRINMGLSSVDEEVEGLKKAERFNEETGLNISFCHQLPKNIIGTPKENREGIPVALGFELDKPEDWYKITHASTIEAIFADNHLGYPNAVYTTKNALQAGSMYQGMFGHFQHTVPGCPDEVWNMSQNVKALGIMAAKYDEKAVVDSNADDSMPAYCADLTSSLTWAKLERYIISDCCRARYAMSFGNFTVNLIHKAAMWLAANETFKKEDQPGIGFIYPNTIDHWDHHLHANYGFQIPEAMMAVLVERKFKTGATFMSVPITEKVTIPTVDEMLDMTAACQRTEEPAKYYEELIDWTKVIKLSRKIMDYSERMFQNVLNGLKEAGVDISDPIELMVILKKIDPFKFEKLFHPSTANEGKKNVAPMLPASLWLKTESQIDELVDELKNLDMVKLLKGKHICIAAGDLHYSGAMVIAEVLSRLGASVVNGGNSLEAIDVLDLADEYGIEDVCISLHNGQALAYAKLIKQLAAERNKKYNFFMGGNLTSFLNENDAEPSNVSGMLREMGIYTSVTVKDLIEQITTSH